MTTRTAVLSVSVTLAGLDLSALNVGEGSGNVHNLYKCIIGL